MVVLYREPWGNTEWTRVEQTAITERCLKHGWDSLFFVKLDNSSTPPKWLPRTHVRLNFADFGIEQAVGAIKARVQELGGKITPVNAVTRAKLVQAEAEYLAERADLFRSLPWIRENVNPAVREICSEIERLCRRVAAEIGVNVTAAAGNSSCVMTDGKVSVAAGWVQPWSNVIDEKVHFAAREFRGRVLLPGQRGWYAFGKPQLLGETRFCPELSRVRELRWVEGEKPAALMTAAEVADRCVRLFLDLHARANRGEIDFSIDLD